MGKIKKPSKPVEVVTFTRYKKVSKKVNHNDQTEKKRDIEQELKDQEKQMKRFRHDVFKFAISGLDHGKRVEAKEGLLIRLGARPKRAKCVNYRELIEQKAKEKEKLEEERKRNQKSGIKNQPRFKSKGKKKRDKSDVKGFDYQVGKFKAGVQYVDKKKFVQ